MQTKKTGKKYKDTVNERNLEYVKEIMTELPSWINEYYTDRRPIQSSNTMKSYMYVYREFLKFLCDSESEFSGLTIPEVSLEHLRKVNIPCAKRYLSYLVDKHTTQNTKKAHFSALINLWNYFVESKEFEGNPFKLVKLPKKGKSSPVYLHKEENEQFYDTILTGDGLSDHVAKFREKQGTGYRDYLICHILGLTGIRVSELVGLDVEDIDIPHRLMRIILKGTSSSNETTNIYLSDTLIEELEYYINEDRPKFSPVKGEHALFLVSQGNYKGERLSVRSVENIVKKYAKAAGTLDAERFSPHKLRHTFGMNALRNTGDIEKVRKLLHHTNIQTTQIYAQAEEESLMDARDVGKVQND